MSEPLPILQRAIELPLAAAEPDLSGFDLRFATFVRVNPVNVAIEVFAGAPGWRRKPVAAAEIDARALEDNGWVRFRLAPSEPLQAGPHTLRLSSPAATASCCVAVYPEIAGLAYGPPVEDDGAPSLLAKGGLAARCLGGGASREGIRLTVARYWVDCYGVYVEGVLDCARLAVRGMRFGAAGESPDALVLEPLATEGGGHRYAFCGYADCPAGRPLLAYLATDAGALTLPLTLPRRPRPQPKVTDLFQRFVDAVNALPAPTLVEIGSRRGHQATQSRRSWFRPHVRYVGVDIHPDDNTDIVGDVHALSSLIQPGSVDAVFSIAVLEHLALPWRVAIEINKVLKPGGIVFHATPQAWPLHELPNDFWRFSDEGLKRLFGPDTGFRIEGAAMDHEVVSYSLYRDPAFLNFPFGESFGNAQIFSAKEREIDPLRLRWDINETAYYDLSRQYAEKVDLG